MIKFMLITNDPDVAQYAENCGVARIFVDLEWMGKQERQGHLDTLISQHTLADVARVKQRLTSAELLVRLNPLHQGTRDEVERAVANGADLLMLPMFYRTQEVAEFSAMVAGRAGVVPLVETLAAATSMAELVEVPGVTEIYIGLNDLHLDMKLRFMFEPLANGLVDELAKIIKSAGLPFGFGGIARVGEGVIPGEMVLGEHLRLGSGAVILSRTFHRKGEGIKDFSENMSLKHELQKLCDAGKVLAARDDEKIRIDQQQFQAAVAQFIARKSE